MPPPPSSMRSNRSISASSSSHGLTRGHDAIDVVMTLGVFAVAREHDDLHAFDRLAQLRDRHGEDRLVAGIQPAIGTDQSYRRCHLAAVPGEDGCLAP